jgi:hypothetical protein
MSTIINDDYNACLFNLPVIYKGLDSCVP